MKCIVRKCGMILAVSILTAGISGCGDEIVLTRQYDTFETTEKYGIGVNTQTSDTAYFASELCVGGNEDVLNESITAELSEAAGIFSLDEGDVIYAKNIHQSLYPASTTKILTAYIALKYGNLQDTAVVSEAALELEAGSTTCGLSVGDTISLEELLYGLMMCSGNDAANVIAEMISGSIEEFAKLMNEEALTLGATNSHFVNPHGLHDEQHYTTVYDLYLIFQAAIKNDMFCQLINTNNHHAEFLNRQGETVVKDWSTTNRYLTGDKEVPNGVTVIGGKTGTTNDAGNCLVLYSKTDAGKPYISIVLKADGRDNLYYHMTELLEEICSD